MQAMNLVAISSSEVVLGGLAVAALTILMLTTRRRVANSRTSSSDSVRERYARLSEHKAAMSDVESVMLDLDQLARDVHGRLDTRIARLEAVIRDADQRIDALSRLAPSAEGRPRLDVLLDDSVEQVDGDTAAVAEKEKPGEHAERIRSSNAEHREAVYRLADGGFSAAAIAKEVDQAIGEVELILNLRAATTEPSVSTVGTGGAVTRS